MTPDFSALAGFEWDAGNTDKNPGKHQIGNAEVEEVFFRLPVVLPATRAEDGEPRWFVFGLSEAGRVLRIVFTVRGSKIRVISARPASRKERTDYEKIRET
ncbi:MAG: BrnT family toxin [Verrucomicrobia bacterium]|nr:BrnT family toxin [Verrucomicrobiota bacterium]